MTEVNKIDRPEGKFARNFKIAYDTASLPDGLSLDIFTKVCDSGYIFYDSTKGNRPKLYETGEANGEDTVVSAFIDTEGKEVDLATFMKSYEDEEFWRKELYKCKQSPLYYYTNYVSLSPKPTQDEITTYLDSIGFTPKDDSTDKEELNEEVKALREKHSKSITLDLLKDLKPVQDKISAEYDDETEVIRKEFAKLKGIVVTNESKIRESLMTFIMKTPVKETLPELRMYINEKNGKWDKALFRATDLDVLLRLWKLL